MLGHPPTPGTRRLTGRPTDPPLQTPKVFTPGWGRGIEQAAPLGQGIECASDFAFQQYD